jgi:hypothetical protein
VFLSPADLDALSESLHITKGEFLRQCCRTVDLGVARRVSLREKLNLDCILWENGGCSRYEARPLQCRSFPFWSACVSSLEEWEQHARNCPGMGQGPVHTREVIECWLARRVNEGLLEG